MTKVEKTVSLPFTVTEFGTIRIGDSRVSLDSVIYQFKIGASPEQIVMGFPSLDLGDVYTAIAYYLANREEVESYLLQQGKEAEELRKRIESDPEHQKAMAKIRARIEAYRAAHPEIDKQGPAA